MARLGPLNVWPDAEKVAIAGLKAFLPNARVLTDTGTTLRTMITEKTAQGGYLLDGVVQVIRNPGGGTDSEHVTEEALIDVYCYAADRGRMWALAARANAAMINLEGAVNAGALIDQVTQYASPGYVDYADPQIFRTVASYGLASQPQYTA